MGDQVVNIGKSVIQHGKENDRIYLMKLSMNDVTHIMQHIMQHINQLLEDYGYTKVFAKIPYAAKQLFLDNGFIQEASIPDFYNGVEECCFMGKFISEERGKEKFALKVQEIIDKALSKKAVFQQLPFAFTIKKAIKDDAGDMANLYKKVFKTYPFPIHDKSYLKQTMDNDVVYFGIWEKENLVALSSCECYAEQSNAEMTDFATLPEYRGQNFALALLNEMEEELKQRKIHMAYTIARAYSFGMNITFSKANYSFAGTLTNNTNIAGSIESMNVWYKPMI